jgi:hypothetical protein
MTGAGLSCLSNSASPTMTLAMTLKETWSVANDQSRLGGSVLRLTRKCLPGAPPFGVVSQAVQKHSKISANSRQSFKVLFFRKDKLSLRTRNFINMSS